MFKHLFLAVLFLLSSFTGKANGFVCEEDVQFYIGIVGGMSALNGEYRAKMTLPEVSPETGIPHHIASVGESNTMVGGVAGASFSFCDDDFFIALQANGLYNSLHKTVRSGTDEIGRLNHAVHIKNNFEYGIDVRFGANFCNAMPYLLAGIEAGEFQVKWLNNTLTPFLGIPAATQEVRNGITVTTPGLVKHKKVLWGPKAGIGITFPVTRDLAFNLEYSYIWFGSINKELVILNEAKNPVQTWNHKFRIHQNTILIGLNYLF